MRSLNPNICILGLLLLMLSQSSIAKDLSQVQSTAQSGTVSLTFEDGPSPIYTPPILDILKKNNVKATFFVMGPLAKKFPKIIDRIVAEGHAVGIHTMTHPKLTRLNDSQLHYEVVGSRDIIQTILGKSPVCLRPPYGITNKHVENYVKANKLILVSTGFDSLDYQNRGVASLTERVINNAHSGQIILLNDGHFKRQQTVAALPHIIAGIRQKGLGFSAICYPVEN
jgi:peptidoglycan/xylan/chitin deacetylase (PgdA/CDA1 family)